MMVQKGQCYNDFIYTIMPEQLVYPADYSQCESQKVVNINGVELMVSEENMGVILLYVC